jgi:hypothetical protein
MNTKFLRVIIKLRTISLLIITSLVFFSATNQVCSAGEEQWQPVPEANYADVLELIAFRSKANYEEIASWQGRMNIHGNTHFYGIDAAEKLHSVDTNGVAKDSQHICKMGKTIADFAVDMRNDRLYSSIEPNVKYKAVDLDQFVPVRKNISTPKTKTILSPESYMWCMPDKVFAPNLRSLPVQKMVFIESPQNENVKEFVRDPRDFFNSCVENDKLWDTLLKIRKSFLDNGNVRIWSYPNIEITSLKTATGTKYRVLTTWKGGENYVIKYIRSSLEVDEALGFNATMVEVTNPDGVKLTSKQYTYEDFNGIYVPKTVTMEQRNNKGEITLTSEISIETTGINKPLPEDTFTIKNFGVEENTLVTDKIKKAEFRFSKGNLVPIEEPNK